MGTLIDVVLLLLGGILGRFVGKWVNKRVEETIIKITGIGIFMMGMSSFLAKALVVDQDGLKTVGEVVLLVSLALGAAIGEFFDFDKKIYDFGMYLKNKSGSENDNSFVTSFVAATCTVSIGAMAIVGSIEDGINGNYSILIAKGVSDAIIVFIMSSTQGKGPIFSAIPVIVFQGTITLIAYLLGPIIPPLSIYNLSLVGSVLICTVGINMTFGTSIRVANILPSILIAGIFGAFGFIR